MGAQDNIDAIVELLQSKSEVLQDMHWVEGNMLTGNKSTIRTGLPEAAWRKINKGVPYSKSDTEQVTDTTGLLEGWSAIDEALINIANNARDFRGSEDTAFLQTLKNKLELALFYGDTDLNPEQFMGLAPRYDTPSDDEDNSGYNLIDAGGSGSDNGSVWLIVWGPNTAHGIVPKGLPVGFKHKDWGKVITYDASGNPLVKYQSQYTWNAGITIRDWRYVVRICNIDVSNLTKDAASGADLLNLMTSAVELPPDLSSGTPAFYAPRRIRAFLRKQEKNANNVILPLKDAAGRPYTSFDGIPVRRSDQLTVAEATITGTFAHDDT